MTEWSYEDIYDRLTPLYALLASLPYEQDFIVVHPEPEPAPSNWSAYRAGISWAMRPYFALMFLVLM
jgi:hypothetical protein